MLKKRIISAALAAAMVLGFAGCNKTPMTDDLFTVKEDDGNYTGDRGLAPEIDVDDGYNTAAIDNTAVNDVYKNAAANNTYDLSNDQTAGASYDTASIQPQAGLLTAGCWSDNENWGFFSNLIASDRLTYPLFGLDPTKRIRITVKSDDGTPAANVKAELLNEKGDTVWAGVSDHNGIVYLMNKNDDKKLSVKLGDGTTQALDLDDDQGGQQKSGTYNTEKEITIGAKGNKYENADIMFIIDSTGSMHDEMDFLQSEFTEITERIGDKNTRYSVNFYRDEGDEYLTKCNPFSSDVKKVQTIINNESAAGGKGQIAAVAQALDQTMNDADWSDESVKLAFLIFDAPPYKEAADSLARSVETAASKGIRLIPVVGSGSDADVELFGRAIAIETGGTYVFLTDDSGIGESHEEPIIGKHEVKPLVDIITEIINEYRGNTK